MPINSTLFNISDVVTSMLPVEKNFRTVNQIFLISNSALFGLGTVLNLWFVVAILSCATLRARLRNQLICNLGILHLAHALVKSPVMVFYTKLLLGDYSWINLCHSLTMAVHLQVVYCFISDWLLVFIVAVFFAQVARVDASKKLKPGVVTAGKAIIHLLPWVASPALILLVRRTLVDMEWCVRGLPGEISIVPINLAAPVFVSIVIVIMASVCRLKRVVGYSASASGHTVRRGSAGDRPFAYVVAVAINVACEIALIVCVVLVTTGLIVRLPFAASAVCVSNARVILLLLPWLLLPDIRERVVSWRPWGCQQTTPSDTDGLTMEEAS